MSERLRVGIIGTGAVAQVAHLNVLSKLDGVEIVVLCDSDLAKARSLATRLHIPDVHDDIDDVFRYSRPDAVAVCTPNHLHEVHVVAALEAGAHVLSERPLALTSGGIERVIAASQRAKRTVMVGMNLRFRTDVQAMRSFVESGELGNLVAIRAGWYTFRPSRQMLGWRLQRQQSGGGAMLDLGLPLIDLAFWVAGDPQATALAAQLATPPSSGAVEDAGCTFIRCDRGLSVFVDVSWRHPGAEEKLWFELVGTRGSASVGPLRVFKEINGTPTDVTPTGASGREDLYSASYRAEWAHFVAAVRGEVESPGLGDQLRLHRVFEAIQRSAEQGRDVQL